VPITTWVLYSHVERLGLVCGEGSDVCAFSERLRGRSGGGQTLRNFASSVARVKQILADECSKDVVKGYADGAMSEDRGKQLLIRTDQSCKEYRRVSRARSSRRLLRGSSESCFCFEQPAYPFPTICSGPPFTVFHLPWAFSPTNLARAIYQFTHDRICHATTDCSECIQYSFLGRPT